MLFDRGHPCFWNFNSIIPVDVIRVKSYVNRNFNPTGVPMWVSVNKLHLIPERIVARRIAANVARSILERREDLYMKGLKNTIETYGLLEHNPPPFQNTAMRRATIRSGMRLSLLTETHIGTQAFFIVLFPNILTNPIISKVQIFVTLHFRTL